MIPYAQKLSEEEANVGRPRTGQTPVQHLRIPDDDWGAFGEVLGRDAHGTIRAVIRWYLREPGAKLPERPARDEIDAARERYAEKQRAKAARQEQD
jgi:hypothetical protein